MDSFIALSVCRKEDRQRNNNIGWPTWETAATRKVVLNYIWLALVLLAVAIGGWNDRLKDVTDGAFDGAKTAVTIALGLIGIMALWLGVMRLAERAGLVQRIARGLRPVMRRLFPDVPVEHPAMGSMLMNMAANMLGLGNAATPLGLRAMRDLETLNPPPATLAPWGLIALVLLGVFFMMVFLRMAAPALFGLSMAPEAAAQNVFVRSVNALSILAIPFLLSFFPLYAAARGVKVYEEFVEGAKEGFGVILKIIPFLVTMLVAIGMFKGAGGIDLLSRALSPILTPLHFPTDLLPLALMRPLSGSATLALLTDIVHRLGPDNIVSLTAATIYGSTETTFYVAAVYFGAVCVKQTRHAIPAGLLADLTGVVASVVICRAVL